MTEEEQRDRDRRIFRKGFVAPIMGDEYIDDAIRAVDREIEAEKDAK